MTKKYIVRLTTEERSELEDIVYKGKIAAYKRLNAQILLKADISEQGPGWTDSQIGEAFGVNIKTIERLRQRLVENGLEGALNRAKSNTKSNQIKVDGEVQAHLMALSCSEAPEGRDRWTWRFYASQMVELEYIDSISHDRSRQVLKQNEINKSKKKNGVFLLPKMLNLLYLRKMYLKFIKNLMTRLIRSFVWMNRVKQQIKEVREPIKTKSGQVERYDFEYERNGVSNWFIFFEPLVGWRHVEVTDHRTAIDWALKVRDLVESDSPALGSLNMIVSKYKIILL